MVIHVWIQKFFSQGGGGGPTNFTIARTHGKSRWGPWFTSVTTFACRLFFLSTPISLCSIKMFVWHYFELKMNLFICPYKFAFSVIFIFFKVMEKLFVAVFLK